MANHLLDARKQLSKCGVHKGASVQMTIIGGLAAKAAVMYVEFVHLHVVARGTGFASISYVNSTPVLIVEDDAACCELMTTVLRLTGFGTVTATNGADALTYLRAGGDACVILLDLMMPVMDGFEFRREQLREPRLAAIPVVVLSTIASARPSELLGCAVIDKPGDVFEVVEIVRQVRALKSRTPEGLLWGDGIGGSLSSAKCVRDRS